MPEADAATYRYDVTDITKVWPHGDYPLIPVGKYVLNRNPTNFFAQMEQVAFNPGNLVPGIELSNDRILQARVFSYPDTQRHRLGANFDQIPVNCPLSGTVHNYQRDGPFTVIQICFHFKILIWYNLKLNSFLSNLNTFNIHPFLMLLLHY